MTTPNSLFGNPVMTPTGIRYGNFGRNLFRGPWFNGWDAGLFKNVNLSERWKLQIRVEVLNAPNHPNFDAIVTDLNSGLFGKSLCAVGNSTCPSAAAPARRVQLGARLTF